MGNNNISNSCIITNFSKKMVNSNKKKRVGKWKKTKNII